MMKKNLALLIIAFAIIFSFTDCKGPKKVGSEAGTEEIQLPFTGKEYQSNKDFFRSKQSGKSPDLSTAKKIALNNAKAEIAGLINSRIKSVTDNYTNQRSLTDVQDFENKFENLVREVVNQQLNDISIIGEKVFKQKNNTYEYWVVIEISRESVMNGINSTISKDTKLQIDYDKKKFEEIYNAEMQKMEQR
jgi:hypothetical protein